MLMVTMRASEADELTAAAALRMFSEWDDAIDIEMRRGWSEDNRALLEAVVARIRARVRQSAIGRRAIPGDSK